MRWHRRPATSARETGDSALGALGSYIGGEVLTPAVISALKDPATQKQLEATIIATLESDQTKKALRPYVVEAAIWATLAITLGAWAWRLISHQRSPTT